MKAVTREAEAEKERQAAQAKANADQAVRLLRDQEREYLTELWDLRFKVRDEITNVGLTEDDEDQAEAQRAQRMAGLKVQWCRTLSELRGCRYRLGEDARKEADPSFPAWLTNVAVGPDDEDMVRDLLRRGRPRDVVNPHPTVAQQSASTETRAAAQAA